MLTRVPAPLRAQVLLSELGQVLRNPVFGTPDSPARASINEGLLKLLEHIDAAADVMPAIPTRRAA